MSSPTLLDRLVQLAQHLGDRPAARRVARRAPSATAGRGTASRRRCPRRGSRRPPRYGPRNIRYMRKVSAPHSSMYSSGFTTLPLHFDIFAPSFTIRPCARKRVNGSSKSSSARVVQHHRDEARVQQVQHGVLVAADVAVHRQPLLRQLAVERHVVAARCSGSAGSTTRCRGRCRSRRSRAAPACRTCGHGRVVPLLVARERGDAGVVGPEVVDRRAARPAAASPAPARRRSRRSR